ncbi:hypothetical protein [Mycobacterium sp.]|uniref:hypothetical protein n=1 Tax=Mycobacterium sp. TaxID=1785 RepID=UPI003D0E23B8
MEERPAHDPLSEEMDLITWQEAAARLYDESVTLKDQIAKLTEKQSADPDDETESQLTAMTNRLEAMGRVADRLRSQRPATSSDRTPTPPS